MVKNFYYIFIYFFGVITEKRQRDEGHNQKMMIARMKLQFILLSTLIVVDCLYGAGSITLTSWKMLLMKIPAIGCCLLYCASRA